jgi:hypothetical protein
MRIFENFDPAFRDDSHAKNDDKGGECPRGKTRCLGRSQLHSNERETIIETASLRKWPP